MKGILKLLGIILGVFFFLGVLPTIYPPSILVILPVGAYLLYKRLNLGNCGKNISNSISDDEALMAYYLLKKRKEREGK